MGVRAETRATLRRLNVPFLLQYFQSNPQLAFRFCSTLGRQFARNFRISSINLELYDLRFASTHTVTGISQKPLVNTPRILTDFFPFLMDSLILYEGEAIVTGGKSSDKRTTILTEKYLCFYGHRVGQTYRGCHKLADIEFLDREGTQSVQIRIVSKGKTYHVSQELIPRDGGGISHRIMQMKFDGDGCERFIQALLALKADDKVEGALSELKPTVTTDLWDSLARQQVNKLVTTQSYQKGDIILEQGQFYSIVVLVFRGLIRLERTLSSGETV